MDSMKEIIKNIFENLSVLPKNNISQIYKIKNNIKESRKVRK